MGVKKNKSMEKVDKSKHRQQIQINISSLFHLRLHESAISVSVYPLFHLFFFTSGRIFPVCVCMCVCVCVCVINK